MALANKELKEASHIIQEIAENYKKMKWIFEFKTPFLKSFGILVHGLYYLAYFTLSSEDFKKIKTPHHIVFWDNFDDYTKSNHFQKGRLILKLEDELSELKVLF